MPRSYNMQKITPHLWFDKEAEEAVKFYTSIFDKSEIFSTSRYPEAGSKIHGMKAGTVMTQHFQIEGFELIALNAGPIFKLNPSISFTVQCPTIDDVSTLWEKLSENGKALMPLDSYPFSEKYGWIQDKFGVTWQLNFVKEVNERKIIPSLMYTNEMAGKAEEAINFYTSIFKDSEIGLIARYGADQAPSEEGTVMYSDFLLSGQKFIAMDSAGPHEFKFNEAISLLVTCKDQEEIDYFWEKLSAFPESEQCGWLKDKYGLSWQIVPSGMEKLISSPDKEKANKGMAAMMKMKKIDISVFEAIQAE